MICLKLHKLYREIVAACDEELLGKKFEEGNCQLEINEAFFKGKVMPEAEVIKLLRLKAKEDATFNLVGERSVKAGIDAGIIKAQAIARIQGIPYALA